MGEKATATGGRVRLWDSSTEPNRCGDAMLAGLLRGQARESDEVKADAQGLAGRGKRKVRTCVEAGGPGVFVVDARRG